MVFYSVEASRKEEKKSLSMAKVKFCEVTTTFLDFNWLLLYKPQANAFVCSSSIIMR